MLLIKKTFFVISLKFSKDFNWYKLQTLERVNFLSLIAVDYALYNLQVGWESLPANIQQQLGNSHKEYDKSIAQFSIKNQVSW